MSEPRNEGEGDKTSDRRYREHVKKFVEENDPEALAQKAEREIEADPDGYRAAEKEGKKHMAGEDPELYEKGVKPEK
jgi:hypothetical protein